MRESPEDATGREAARLPRLVRELHARFEPTFAGRCAERILELQPFERGLGLASRAFVAMLPLIIVASALSPAARSGGFAHGLIDRFGLTGQGASYVRRLFATPDQVRGGTTIFQIIVLVYAVLSFARLLARTYERAWRLPRGFPGRLPRPRLGRRGGRVHRRALPLRLATENTGTAVANTVAVRSRRSSGCSRRTCCSPAGSAGRRWCPPC